MFDTQVGFEAKAPTRVDLAGGTLDISPIVPILQEKYDLWNSPVKMVNVAIDLFARATVQCKKSTRFSYHFKDLSQQKEERGTDLGGDNAKDYLLPRAVLRFFKKDLEEKGLNEITVSTMGEAPRGSGLGGSSSLVIAIIACFNQVLKRNMTVKEMCFLAQNVEAGLLGNLAGNQDHFAAANGGVQAVSHTCEGTMGEKIVCDGDELLKHLVLAYSGQQHFSAFSNWQMMQKALSGDKTILEKFARIAKTTLSLPALLTAHNWQAVGKLLSEEWELRRTLADGITTDVLDKMYANAMSAGAIGGKVCGAGGGGVLVMAVDKNKNAIEKAIEAAGGIILRAGFSKKGVEVTSL